MSPVKDGLRDRPERKPIITPNYYAALNYTETLEDDKDHIMVKLQLHGDKETTNINTMVDSGATKDFIDKEVCRKHRIKMIKAEVERKIYLADGKLSAMGPVTHMRKYVWTSATIRNWQPSKWQIFHTMMSSSGCHGYEDTIQQSIGTKEKSHSTANDVPQNVSTLRLLHMRYLKRKPWKRTLSPGSPRSRPKKTRASKSRSYHQRPGCLPEDQTRLQDTTCMQTKEKRFLLEDKSWLELE